MTLAPSELALVAAEIEPLAGAARIQKITAPAPHTVALELRLPGRSVVLLLEAAAAVGRACLLDARPPAPPRPIAFQGLLRAQLSGGRLTHALFERPRTLHLSFETAGGVRSLRLELDRRGGAIVITDEQDRILGAGLAQGAPERTLKRMTPYAPVSHAGPDEPSRLVPVASADFPISAAIEHLYAPRQESDSLEARRRTLLTSLRAARKKLDRTLGRIDEDLARIDEASHHRRHGDLLKTVLHKARRGDPSVRATEYDETGAHEVEVPLVAHLSPQENLERYYHLHHRLTRAAPLVHARRGALVHRLSRLTELATDAESADDLNHLVSIETAAREQLPSGAPGDRRPTSQPGTPTRRPFREFRSGSGVRIWVGRGAKDNDALTFRVASGQDLWLHARGRTGSHVIVPGPGTEGPDHETLLDAACLAAHFSSGRGEKLVDVAATRRKYVQKIKGTVGAVRYSQERNIAVGLDEARIARLLSTEQKS